jgi:hypothetical protein
LSEQRQSQSHDLLSVMVIHLLPTLQPVFDKTSNDYFVLSSLCKRPVNYLTDERVLNSEALVAFIQFLFLLGLLMYGGMNTPALQSISYENGQLNIHWDTKYQHSFQFGTFDEGFQQFQKAYQKRILDLPPSSPMESSVFQRFYHIFLVYRNNLGLSISQLTTLLSPDTDLANSDLESLSESLLFVLISALPRGEINSLFMYIQEFFPENLEVMSSMGNRINISSFFSTTSSDLNYMLHKVLTYIRLYNTPDLPIIRHITRSKTREFLSDLLSNSRNLAETRSNLQSTLEHQFNTRQQLYVLFIDLLSAWYNKPYQAHDTKPSSIL